MENNKEKFCPIISNSIGFLTPGTDAKKGIFQPGQVDVKIVFQGIPCAKEKCLFYELCKKYILENQEEIIQ